MVNLWKSLQRTGEEQRVDNKEELNQILKLFQQKDLCSCVSFTPYVSKSIFFLKKKFHKMQKKILQKLLLKMEKGSFQLNKEKE